MKTELLKEYARVIVKIGVNVQKGQDVNIVTSINQVELATYVTKEAYKAGARRVICDFSCPEIKRLKLINESIDTLSELSNEKRGRYEDFLNHPTVRIFIDDEDPDLLNGVEVEKLVEPNKRLYPYIKKYIDALDGQTQWTIVAMPSLSWAKKMYPNESSDEEAISKLEDAIIKTMRMNNGNADENWAKHIEYLQNKAQILNELHLNKLIYTSNNGTNFSVGLHKDHIWCTAWEKQRNGIASCVNMPTEEVFTIPELYSANGLLVASKPLSYNGNLIEDFTIEFKDGKAINVTAKKGLEHLEEMIKMDEAAAYLGEIALVPYDSPINQIGTLFYNTLFDENAACHIALGDGISEALKGYEKMNKEEIKNAGVNDSMIHVDFMIGTEDMKIIGIKDNDEEITIFNNGKWSI